MFMQTEKTTRDFTITAFPPERQGSGSFDNGKITEIKPIPFPSETGGSKRLGPIFYWAWASAKGDGIIGMHPHQGFEIVSYVLDGTVGHTDTAGNRRRVSKGGIQVMQTGSGISHQEEMHGESTDFFQVWFEPELRLALQKTPSYTDVEGGRFPLETTESGAKLKRVIGPKGAVQLDASVVWDEVTLPPHSEYTLGWHQSPSTPVPLLHRPLFLPTSR